MDIDFSFFAQRVAMLATFSGFIGAALFFTVMNAIGLIGAHLAGYLAKRQRIKQARQRSAQFAGAMPRG